MGVALAVFLFLRIAATSPGNDETAVSVDCVSQASGTCSVTCSSTCSEVDVSSKPARLSLRRVILIVTQTGAGKKASFCTGQSRYARQDQGAGWNSSVATGQNRDLLTHTSFGNVGEHIFFKETESQKASVRVQSYPLHLPS